MRPLHVTVCELPDDRAQFQNAWAALVDHVRTSASQLVLLPEMPFAPWLAASPSFDASAWDAAVAEHDAWLPRLADLAPAAVIGSRPVTRGSLRLNEGFVRDTAHGYRAVHDKRFLPDEDGYWEAKWYSPGDGRFEPAAIAGAQVGMLVCTELWSLGHAQQYGRKGAEVIVTPRATGKPTVEKWLVGGKAAAIVSGAFSLSSNWTAGENAGDFGGAGWIIDPDGRELARTSPAQPFQSAAIDLDAAVAAKRTYPRYAIMET
jgi:N-carbamoylputrescine amidase